MTDTVIMASSDLDHPHVVQDAVDGQVYIRRRGRGGRHGPWEYMDLGDRPHWFPKALIERTFKNVDDAKDELRRYAEVQAQYGQPDFVVAVLRPA